ncbi:MAG: phage tail protein [Actinomycetota bacterium]
MPARSPEVIKGPTAPTAPGPAAAVKAESPGADVLPVSDGRSDEVQARHATLLADPRLDNAAGDGQQIRLLQALQRTYGNAHVAGVIAQLKAAEAGRRNRNGTASPTLSVQLQGATVCPAPPKEPVATPPEADPNFRSVGGEVKKGATTLKRHDPAQKKVGEAQGAAKAPPDDIESQSKAAKADTMSAAKPGTFDKAAFMAAVRKAIEAKAPKNLDEADKFASSGNADVKGEVTGKVTQSREGATKDIKEKTEQPPDPSKAKPKEVKAAVEEKPGPRPPDPAGARAMPSPAPPEEKNLGAGKCEVDSQMKEADVTEEQLARSNEPTFTGALKDKKETEKHADRAPAEVEREEKATLEGAKKGAAADARGSMTAMYGAKKGAAEKVGAGKTRAQTKDEAERAKVSGEVKAIYDRTESDVKGILDGLDKKVDTAFDRGEAEAKRAFAQRHESEMKAYKDRRYGGLFGKARWLKDLFAGLPEEANQIYIRARDTVYLPKMDKVISEVADIVGGELNRAKQRIEGGRAEIKKYVAGLPANLKKFGAEAQKEFSSKFDELEQSVEDKQSELVDKLATKYVEARDKVDEEIKKMQEANKGLVAKVADAIGGVIKTILELKNLLLGVLARVAGVIGKILKDPIGFLGNLISGVKGGLGAFLGNIAEHLKKGVVGWLLGNMRSAGLELPARFDLKGIITMLASLLGLTWAAIRGRVLQRGVPEQAMSAVEKAVPEAQTLKSEGVGGLWQKIAAQVGDIKEMILTKLRGYLVPTIIMAGITWIISLLNPASAFIKAVKAIIDIVRFIFERAAQLFEFINAVLDAIVTIAGGAIGAAVKAIENALAKSIPVLIGFLAAILGIGGLANKVKAIFQALSKPVMKVIDKVVDFIVKAGKKLWAKLKGKGADRGDARSDSEKRAAVHSARLAGDRLLERPDATAESVQSQLPPLRQQHGVKKLDLVSSGGARHHIYAQLVEESGDDKTLSKTEKPDPPLKGPHDRHYLNRIRPSSRKKEKNTVILPGTDVQGDINLINEGKVEKIHGRYTVNRRTYEVENRTTLFPISGEGFIEMNRGAYLALQIYIENNGDTEEARLKLDRNAIGSEQREVALRVFRMRGG